jgi:hypothetical protein
MNTMLAPALSREVARFGGLACYVGGEGPPLSPVHSVNADGPDPDRRTDRGGHVVGQ